MRLSSWFFIVILLIIPLLHRYWVKRNRSARVMFPLPVPPAVSARSPVKLLLFLKYIGLVFFVIALARPQSSFKQTERTVAGIDIILVLDISASMNIEDLSERPRIDIAKDVMQDFIKGRSNDRIGSVVFSGEPLTLAPPTLDYALVTKAIRDAKIGVLKDGTAIGDGLALATSHLKNSKAKSRIIVLLTDGDNNVGQVDPATAGELAKGFGIKVYTIAIGREGRVRLPIKHKGPFGNTITTYQWFENALNPELLQQIAKRTDAKFYRVTDESALESVFSEINRLEKTEIKASEKTRYDERCDKFLKLGLLALVVEQVFARGWWRLVP